MQMAYGTFVGNGTTQSISGLGFQPNLVIIHNDSATASVRTSWRSTSHTGDKTSSFVGAVANFANGITSLDADGFSVGSSNDTNENTKTIHWVAFKRQGGDFSYGTYVGTGSAQSITGLGFRPDLVVVKQDFTNARGGWTTSTPAANNTFKFEGAVFTTGGITSLDANGFSVGTDIVANENGKTYFWFAFKQFSSNLKVGSYTTDGSPADNRSVTGVGFQPLMVWIRSNNIGDNAALRMPTNAGDSSFPAWGGASAANIIQANETDGFQLGTNSVVQRASSTFYYAAFGIAVPTGFSSAQKSLVLTMSPDDDDLFG